MGHYCKICGCNRANEKFSGKGHKNHICKECSKLPKEKIQFEMAMEEIFDFMHQSNISQKNIERLQKHLQSSNETIVKHASLVLEVAKIKPHKRRRIKFLARENRELLNQLFETGLILDHW
jgi:hypothetical protein